MFKTIKKIFVKEIEQPRPPNTAFLMMPNSKVDYQRKVGAGLRSNVIMSPVQWVMRTFPESRLVIERTNADDEAEFIEHEMLDLIDKPNEFYTYETLIMATLLSWNTSGNAYWLKIRGNGNQVSELWYVPHWMITPKSEKNNPRSYIDYYEYKPVSEVYRYEVNDVVHFRFGLDPENIRLGLSPLNAVIREIYTDDEASNFSAAILRNMGVPGVVISPDAEMTIDTEAALEIKEKFKEMFSGDNRGEAMVMTGKTKIETFGFNPQQLKLGDIRDISEERVCAALGLPAAVVGFGSGLQQTKVGATMEALISLAWSGNLIPTQRILAKVLQNQLLTDYGDTEDLKVKFDNSEVLALGENKNDRIARLDMGVRSGWVKVSEARAAEGLPVEAEDEVYLRPFGFDELGSEGMGEPEKSIKKKDDDTKTLFEERIADTAQVVRPKRWQYRLARELEADAQYYLKRFRSGLIKKLTEINDVVRDAAVKFINSKQAESEIDADEIIENLDFIVIDNGLKELYKANYKRIMSATIKRVNGAMELGISLPDFRQNEILAEGGKRVGLLDMESGVRDNIYKVLEEGRTQGESVAQLARRLSDMDGFSAGRFNDVRTRAQLIARTEVGHAQNISAAETYKEGGVTHVLIMDSRKGSFDADCDSLNGAVVTLQEGMQLMRDEHPNGTRQMIAEPPPV